jgi:RNA polymerase sigma-70 factor (ECF subfamily)
LGVRQDHTLREREQSVAPNPAADMQRDLVALAREGDHDAFSSLAATSIATLYGVARVILGNIERAEDAVQDALVLAWRDIGGLRDIDRFDAWLYRLVVRACYRQAGRDRRRAVVELRLLANDDEPEPSGIESSVVERDRIERGFRRLAPDQRAVLVLHHHLGLGLAEVAEILEIPVGTAKSRLFRATQTIRSAIEADDRDPIAVKGRTA